MEEPNLYREYSALSGICYMGVEVLVEVVWAWVHGDWFWHPGPQRLRLILLAGWVWHTNSIAKPRSCPCSMVNIRSSLWPCIISLVICMNGLLVQVTTVLTYSPACKKAAGKETSLNLTDTADIYLRWNVGGKWTSITLTVSLLFLTEGKPRSSFPSGLVFLKIQF